jgi:imidazolonepropionase-like amidohydrolase
MQRDLARSRTWLVRDARIFAGDGSVVEHGSILVQDGKIAEIYTGAAPDPKTLNAEAIEAAGKTILPGLIDMHVHLGSPGIMIPEAFTSAGPDYVRELAAYLYSGVTGVRSVGDGLDDMLQLRGTMNSGARLGADLFTVGPMFTAENGHGTEYAQYIPEQFREQFQQQTVRLPKTPDEARTQVKELKARGVDGIKAILEAGSGSRLFPRMDTSILNAIAKNARAEKLSLVVHTGDAQDIADALAAGANGIEHGSIRAPIPDEIFARMKAAGVAYDPTLAVIEAVQAYASGNLAPLERSLVQQVMPGGLFEKVRKAHIERTASNGILLDMDVAQKNLAAAYRGGVTLIAGTDSGNPFMVHGPGLHRELQLWVAAGIPPAAALQAATLNAARALGADGRIGSIQQGREANLILVDGNPLEDIAATERISLVLFKGERVNRQALFSQK